MNKQQRAHEKKVQVVIGEVKKLVKKYGLDDVRQGFNRYINAVRTLSRLKKNVAQAETEMKKFLGRTKI